MGKRAPLSRLSCLFLEKILRSRFSNSRTISKAILAANSQSEHADPSLHQLITRPCMRAATCKISNSSFQIKCTTTIKSTCATWMTTDRNRYYFPKPGRVEPCHAQLFHLVSCINAYYFVLINIVDVLPSSRQTQIVHSLLTSIYTYIPVYTAYIYWLVHSSKAVLLASMCCSLIKKLGHDKQVECAVLLHFRSASDLAHAGMSAGRNSAPHLPSLP